MKQAFVILTLLFVFNLVSFSQQLKDDLAKGISSNCGHSIITPTVNNALKLISVSFSDFETLMKINNYEYNKSENSYWAKSGAGCNFYVINKKYDYITFFWTGDRKMINDLFDELKLNKIKLATKGNSQVAIINVKGMRYELSIQDLGNGSGGLTFQENGISTMNDESLPKENTVIPNNSKIRTEVKEQSETKKPNTDGKLPLPKIPTDGSAITIFTKEMLWSEKALADTIDNTLLVDAGKYFIGEIIKVEKDNNGSISGIKIYSKKDNDDMFINVDDPAEGKEMCIVCLEWFNEIVRPGRKIKYSFYEGGAQGGFFYLSYLQVLPE